ncbi:methionine adenosyltransferase domain-containing protein [Anaerobacillus sp. HL2]|nr:methionine adenosyltransferase domain-containing protein [Anaerobacillus sp. HL2]
MSQRKNHQGHPPDGKAQVNVEYDGDKPIRVKTVVVSVQHHKDKTQKDIKSDILNNAGRSRCFEDFPLDDETEILINPSGRFVEGGPAADTGLTGRKIMVDTYGVWLLMGAEHSVERTRQRLIEAVPIWPDTLRILFGAGLLINARGRYFSYAIGKQIQWQS